MRVSFKDRNVGNAFLYVIYKVFRIFYVALWFYISPFLAISIQFLVPYKNLKFG